MSLFTPEFTTKANLAVTALVAYLTSPEGSSARKRLANKTTEKDLVGKDGITRKVISQPLGAFWEIPATIATQVSEVVKGLAQAKSGKYLVFSLGSQEYEIGAVNVNQLTSAQEIWFAKKGLLGSHPMSTEDLLSALNKQEIQRMVVPIETAGLTSAVTQHQAVDELYKAPEKTPFS